MVKKSLHHTIYYEEILNRISALSEDSTPKWGKMNAAQMLHHCHLILQIPLRKIELPKLHFLLKAVGIATKKEIQIFNNGIPHNMPTFKKVIVNFECDFHEAEKNLQITLKEYLETYKNNDLPGNHALFGVMTPEDWGFLEYKHLNHHLKQFNV
ncbi:DUF1569 domain-containing protein [Chryseobacterium sp. GMJ5]|uniref:DUF1569 domain-containing protein n=1 Tax=Chryseobacterium gilvum TaxID=2976534 RepID=A0ABT2VVP5_9FLAO|nr:DUF1569 domain-containing protein [Chryseobacterium gilvum]MCU7613694.1 DUF1569 domain-containing protein [Chryseobacterium gilvum]